MTDIDHAALGGDYAGELAPCRFCGRVPSGPEGNHAYGLDRSPDPFSDLNHSSFLIRCWNDDCPVEPVLEWYPKAEAVEAWNRLHTTDRPIGDNGAFEVAETWINKAPHLAGCDVSSDCDCDCGRDIVLARLDNAIADRPIGDRAVREALEAMIYETTHLSPMEPNGDHWCRITAATLEKARAVLNPDHSTWSEKNCAGPLISALTKVMPIRVNDGPDYAEAYFADGVKHSTQAMTMNPQDWRDLQSAWDAYSAALRTMPLLGNGEAT